MATLSYHGYANNIEMYATATYTVENTPTKLTLRLTSIYGSYSASRSIEESDVMITVKFDGNKIGELNLTSGNMSESKTTNPNKTITINKTHSQQGSKRLDLYHSAFFVYSGASSISSAGTYLVDHEFITIAAKDNYAVTYNANSGVGAPAATRKWYSEDLTLSSAKPTRENYAFKRWNTSQVDTGTSYNPGATYTRNEALYLYAIWNPLIYYKPNTTEKVSNMPATQTKVYGSTLSISSTKPTRPAYVFNSWNTGSTGGGTKYRGTNGATSYSGNTPLTLYAIWNATVAYSANGGSGAPATQTKTYQTALTLSSTRPTRAGYEFDGWNTKADGTGTSYASGGTFTSEKSVTLYAKWKRVPQPPTVSSLTAWRTNAQGTKDDSGTYALVTVKWTVDTFTVGNTIAASNGITGQYKSTTSSTWSSTFLFYTTSSGSTLPSGSSGTSYALISGLSTDSQYTIKVNVKDRLGKITTTTVVLTRAKFVLDFGAGGDSIGIGSAAPEVLMGQNPLLEVGWRSQFDEDVSMLKNLSVDSGLSVQGALSGDAFAITSYMSDVASDVSGSSWHITTQLAKKYLRIVEVCLTLTTNAVVSPGGNAIHIATMASAFSPLRITNSAVYMGFANEYGIGYVSSSGYVYFRPLVEIGTSDNVHVALTFIK